MVVHDRLQTTGGRGRQDLRAARRKASKTGGMVASRARQDLRAAQREVDRESVSAAARRAGQAVAVAGEPATGGSSDQRSKEVYRRAQDAAQMGAPVQATLEPMTGSDEIGSFATGAGGFVGPTEPEPAGIAGPPGGGIEDLLFFDGTSETPADDLGGGFFGDPFGSEADDDDDDRDDGNPLEFDDTMLFGGGEF